MTKEPKRKPCANERAVRKILIGFDAFSSTRPAERRRRPTVELYAEFVRSRWENARTRLTVIKHLITYAPQPGRVEEALDRLRTHYVLKEFVDDAAAAPQVLKVLHSKKELWSYARRIGNFTYGKYRSDRVYSAMWALAIVTGNRAAHVAKCTSLHVHYHRHDPEGVPASVTVRWGRRKGATTASSVEYATDGLPPVVWAYIADVWSPTGSPTIRPFSAMRGESVASCVNRWLKEKRKFRIAQRRTPRDYPVLTSSSPRVYGVNRDLDLLHAQEITRDQYENRTGHTVSVAERSYRRTRNTPTTVGQKPRRARQASHPPSGKKQKR